MKRIVVIGNSGAGKSTLAAQIASRLRLPYIASDPFYWEADWIPAVSAVVRQRIVEAVTNDAWVIDGNCIAERDVGVRFKFRALLKAGQKSPRAYEKGCPNPESHPGMLSGAGQTR